MHELSLVESMMKELDLFLEKEGCPSLISIKVAIGRLSGVDPECFKFAYEAVVKDTEMEKVKLLIEEIPFEILCGDCTAKTKTDLPFMKCGKCGSKNVSLVSGREFMIREVELERSEQ